MAGKILLSLIRNHLKTTNKQTITIDTHIPSLVKPGGISNPHPQDRKMESR